MMRTVRRLALLAAVPAVLLGVTGCGSTVSSDDVEGQIQSALEEQIGSRPDVSCPDDLDGEVDATTRCEITDPSTGDKYGVTVTVASIEDDTANLDIAVDDEPGGI